MLEALKLINEFVSAGDRVIVGAEKPSALEWLSDLLSDLPSYIPDSEPIPAILALDANIEKRNAAIDEARDNPDIPVLLISVGKGKEGLNLPEFSKLITLDFGWVPGDLDQFRHRILRPGQAGEVEIIHLYHEGMINDYMHQLCNAKADAIAEVIDGQESSFDYSQWRDYRTFALEMLSKEGYVFATKALTENELAKTA
jgi:SNF2 family DNA or RNA helicase